MARQTQPVTTAVKVAPPLMQLIVVAMLVAMQVAMKLAPVALQARRTPVGPAPLPSRRPRPQHVRATRQRGCLWSTSEHWTLQWLTFWARQRQRRMLLTGL